MIYKRYSTTDNRKGRPVIIRALKKSIRGLFQQPVIVSSFPFSTFLRGWCLALFAMALIVTLAPVPSRAGALLVVEGKGLMSLSGVYEAEGEVYLSLPELLSALGFSFSWQARTNKLVGKKGDMSLIVSPGTHHVISGTKTWRLGHPPRFINGTLCVPVEFVDRALPELCGLKVRLRDLQPVKPPSLAETLQRAQNIKRIVIDPGHGGHDPGAKSPQGICEKDINLAVALKLRDRLVQDMGVDVVLTRDGDYFLPLDGRTTIGNRSGADLFLSIHANGARRREATGLETYFLSFEATDRQAAMLAAEENRSARLEEGSMFAGLSEEDDMLAILRDMASTENMKESEKLAAAVQRRLVQTLSLPNRGVKQAPFFVLVGSRIPAILVEVGFVSNPEEAARLMDPKIQEKIAGALTDAILYYDQTLSLRADSEKKP